MELTQASSAQTNRNWSRKQISILLTILALILWSISITQAEFEIGKYGLIHGFPAIFFVALGILTIASAILWTSKESHGKLLLLQLCFLVASLFLAPLIVGGAQPMLPFVYSAEGAIEYVVRNGHIAEIPSYALWEHNWPGGPIFWAVIVKTIDTDVWSFISFLQWLPIIWQFIFLLLVFIFLKKVVSVSSCPNYWWAGLWLFSLSNWLGQQNNNPQAFGIVVILAMLFLLPIAQQRKGKMVVLGNRFSIVVILAFVAVTHFLSSLIILFTTAMLYVVRRIRSFGLVAVSFTMIAGWAMFGADYYLRWKLGASYDQLFGLGATIESNVVNPLSSDPSHAAVAMVRVVLSGIIVLISITGVFLGLRSKDNSYVDTSLFVITGGYGLVAVAFATNYGSEGLLRIFLYSLPLMIYFGIKLLRSQITALALTVLMVLMLPLTFISLYGNQVIDYLSPSYLSGAQFFDENTSSGHIVAVQPMGTIRNVEGYTYHKHSNLEWVDGNLRNIGSMVDPTTDYICVDEHDQSYYTHLKDEPELITEIDNSLNMATNCNLVFSNPTFKLYCSQRQIGQAL